MTTATDIAVTTAKSVVILDHIKNNRIEYLLLVAIGHLIGKRRALRNWLVLQSESHGSD